ncbi:MULTISPECIES: SymE family type I addiction module toxin [Lelliottia]|uniref:SymE family type I addiction module toxin n=1 Tax=Lelliottia wanjuensis TaxID=3050585 RepID=A0AAP4FYV6_9ENTR|nr:MULTISPECIES: SymE family type I addiction module toxin [unclassified Lelliottia]MDI3360160.1 SymE family type I addiction module toxin [Lelliottia sp. V89_13]MDK9359145.1 SymE family type I addiction module toxin [Lelliottia sp. V106_16]MDK9366249.1 SymE family type I addiction module toxin [Lelliottia sp. V106_12]MDK9373279.1 SymE family type I addiction module toxin [Lelliottia sp. V106_10]MDK9550439.1 SymE family type I addiction module toxin [Lelliottia sp. V89_5]
MSEMIAVQPQRHLKVGYFRKRHEDRNTKIPKRYSVHAALSLKGDWLEQAGFKTNSQVRVVVEHGKLLIELMDKPVA